MIEAVATPMKIWRYHIPTKTILSTYEIAMTETVANINEDLAIPYSYKKQILSTYE
jgi:hypothetical protein